MLDKKIKILLISSVDPSIGPAVVAEDFYNRLKKNGYDVDFMTPYPVKERSEYLYVYKNKYRYWFTPTFLYRKLTENNRIVRYFKKQEKGYYFFYTNETCPPMSVNDILRKIKKKYDVVIVSFWQGMLSFKTINAIHNKLNCLMYFACVDYSVMSGGCHFTRDCDKFKTGCGNCPGIMSKKINDFTRFNVKYRKKVYEKVKPIVTGNTYMHKYYDESYLLGSYDRKIKTYISLNLDKYKEGDRCVIRDKYNISNDKNFVMLFGAQNLNDPRKGFKYLFEAFKKFKQSLTYTEQTKILIITIGRNIEMIKDKLPFDYLHFGYVNSQELPNIYSVADVFLSPSIDDAGPSMVNQSLACGTPVVAFEMGTALDCIKDKNTGYCANLRDSVDFANGIEKIFRMSNSEYNSMRIDCRKVAEELFSEESSIRRFNEVISKYL